MESVTQEKIKAKRSLDTWIESNNNEQLLMSNDIGTNFYNAPEIDSGFYNEICSR